jgi:hypothetical protein
VIVVVVEGAETAARLRELVRPGVEVLALASAAGRRTFETVFVVGVVRHRMTPAQKRWLASVCAVNADVVWQ